MESIVEELRRDREAGTRRLEGDYRAGLMTLARRLCADEGDAEELVNRTFAAVVEGIDRYVEQSAFFGWMCQILANIHSTDVRRRSNRVEFADADAVATAPDDGADMRLFRDVDASLLRDAVETLPANMREAILLHYFLDMPVAKIARFLSVPNGTVMSRLHYARLALAAKLGAAARRPGVKMVMLALLLVAGLAVARGVYAWIAPAAESEPHAESAEFAEVASHAESAENAESENAAGGGLERARSALPTSAKPASNAAEGGLEPSTTENTQMNAKSLLAATASLALAAAPSQGGAIWTKTALTQQDAELVTGRENLAHSSRTVLSVADNSPANTEKAWQSPMELLVNGYFDTILSAADEGHLYPMRTGSKATLTFGAAARIDEVRIYSCWCSSGRVGVGVASVDVQDAEGNWTSIAGSALPFAAGGSNCGWSHVFADPEGAALAASANAVRISFGTMDNGWSGIAEIEVLGAHLGTHTVTFCDEDGDPLPGVATQTVATGLAATAPDESFVPSKAGLAIIGWDADITEVFEDLRPRPVYGSATISLSQNGAWTKTLLATQSDTLSPAISNLARRATTTLSVEGGSSTAKVGPPALVNGVFEAHTDLSNDDTDTYLVRNNAVMTFEFGIEARVDALRLYSTWPSAGRIDLSVQSVEARDSIGVWRTLEGSALPFADTTGSASKGTRCVFADTEGGPLATGVTALRVNFGSVDNNYAGLAEVEVLGTLTGVCTVVFCDEDGEPLPGVEPQTVAAGEAAEEPDASLVPEKAGYVFFGWDVAFDTVISNLYPRPVYRALGEVFATAGAFEAGRRIPFGLNVLAESGAVAANGAVALAVSGGVLGYNRANTNAAVLVDGRFVRANGESDVAALGTGLRLQYDLPSPRDVASVGIYSAWSNGGRDGFALSSLQYKAEGDTAWRTISFDEVSVGLGDNYSAGSYFATVARAGGAPLLTNAVSVAIPFSTMDNASAGIGEIQALRAPLAAPRAAWTGENWSGTVHRPAGINLLRGAHGAATSFVRNSAAPDAAALASLFDGLVSADSAAVCPVGTDALFEATFDEAQNVSRIEFWTNGDASHDGFAVNEILFRRDGSDAFETNDDMDPFRYGTVEVDGGDTSSGRLHVVVNSAGGGNLAEDVTGVRIWFGRADNDRTDLQELEIVTDRHPATVIIVR